MEKIIDSRLFVRRPTTSQLSDRLCSELQTKHNSPEIFITLPAVAFDTVLSWKSEFLQKTQRGGCAFQTNFGESLLCTKMAFTHTNSSVDADVRKKRLFYLGQKFREEQQNLRFHSRRNLQENKKTAVKPITSFHVDRNTEMFCAICHCMTIFQFDSIYFCILTSVLASVYSVSRILCWSRYSMHGPLIPSCSFSSSNRMTSIFSRWTGNTVFSMETLWSVEKRKPELSTNEMWQRSERKNERMTC